MRYASPDASPPLMLFRFAHLFEFTVFTFLPITQAEAPAFSSGKRPSMARAGLTQKRMDVENAGHAREGEEE